MTADERLRELATQVRRYAGRPNSLFGEPGVLKEICKLFGFKNDCRQGHVYITDTKLARLDLPPATEPLPEKWGGVPASLEEDHAQAKRDRRGPTEVPTGEMVGADKMSPRERAWAALLALKAGWPVEPRDWEYDAASDTVVVEKMVDGRIAETFSVVRHGLATTLAEIEERFGAGARGQVEAVIGG